MGLRMVGSSWSTNRPHFPSSWLTLEHSNRPPRIVLAQRQEDYDVNVMSDLHTNIKIVGDRQRGAGRNVPVIVCRTPPAPSPANMTDPTGTPPTPLSKVGRESHSIQNSTIASPPVNAGEAICSRIDEEADAIIDGSDVDE